MRRSSGVGRMNHVELLRELVEIESPTYSEGPSRVALRVGEELAALGARVRLLEGDHLVADLPGEGAPLLVVGHTDTVWPVGTLAEMPFRVEDGRAYGPGAYDMKASLVVMIEALRRAERRRPVRVFLSADEERGSRTAKRYLEFFAEGVAAALVVEPPSLQGDLVVARRGTGRFRLSIVGRPSHSGIARAEGVSAIEELAHQVLRLHALNGDTVSVNVGVVSGGTTENVVAGEAEARIDVRVATGVDVSRVERAFAALTPVLDGSVLSMSGDWTRPPLEPTEGSLRLFHRARLHAAELSLTIRESSSGGSSDANLLAPLGVPVLDGFGAMGGGFHARDENVLLASIPVRAALLARLVEDAEL